jgi:sirohydrochlorin ferrochelatase
MDAVILFSHGSLLCGSGEALKTHAVNLQERGIAPIVQVGYLNYSEPLFSETVERCAAAGATRIMVAPYFLVPGYFVKVDLPKAVDAARKMHPEMQFVVAEPIGFDERLADALIDSAASASEIETWRDDLKNASLHCLANPLCPLYGTVDCPSQAISVGSAKEAE